MDGIGRYDALIDRGWRVTVLQGPPGTSPDGHGIHSQTVGDVLLHVTEDSDRICLNVGGVIIGPEMLKEILRRIKILYTFVYEQLHVWNIPSDVENNILQYLFKYAPNI